MILVSGSLAYDYIMDFPGYFRDHILPDKLHVLSVSFLIDKMERNFGGTAGNIAYNLALLGEKPTILSSAGNDFKEYGKWLRAKGIGLRALRNVKGAPTAAAYIMTDRADCQIVGFYPGAMQRAALQLRANSIGHRALMKLLALSPKPLAIIAPGNLDDMKMLPALYKKYKVSYIYDPGQNIAALTGADLRQGITGAKVFIFNDYELAMVLKKTGWRKREMVNRVEALVTTLGEKGSTIEIRNSKFEIRGMKSKTSFQFPVSSFKIPPAKPKNTSDPTGAGDAYRAGFIKGLLMGLPYDKVGKLAATVAAYTVEKYGTQTHTFTWSGLCKRYRENFKESLL
ncbi:carbohydrate kinase family protein [Candidatus Uhrbacteria bacterium]|nr:carbohydrate kinase family protein [Candidatus Uhrbacteria bacterium]